MKLLFDHNLAPRLARELQSEFPDSAHVQDFDLQAANDLEFWDFAIRREFAIVSKDSDFHQLAFMRGPPPKVIWIRRGNCNTDDVAAVLRAGRKAVERFMGDAESAFLILE